jgi:uncharacterized protein HemY
LDEASMAYGRARSIFSEIGNPHGQAMALAKLGVIYTRQGRWVEAVAALEQARANLGKLADRRAEAKALADLSDVTSNRADWARRS